ncbi:MAG: sensor histidine kinase [Ktedonobacterales bacterium]
MDQPAPDTSKEHEIYRDYERGRRLQLARILVPTLALIQFGVFVVSVAFILRVRYAAPTEQIFLVNTALVGACALLHASGLRFIRRGEVTRATFSVIIPAGITIVVPLLVYDIFDAGAMGGTSPILAITLGEMVGTLVLIVLAGVMATNRWVLVTTTLLMNVFTIFILTSALQAGAAARLLGSELLLLVTFPMLVQWAVAGILFAAAGTYFQTLRELGDVRVAYARAQQLDELKDQFITHVNHELRSPVMAIQGHVELLLLTEQTLSSDERHTYLERAKRAGDNLVSLVTSVLEMRRLDQSAEAFTAEPVELRAALTAALDLIDPRESNHVQRELRVSIPPQLAVLAEPVRVRQILTNLLSNALKYSPSGTPVEVAAAVVQPQRGGGARRLRGGAAVAAPLVEITIRDYGFGIPPDQLPLLFTRFVRLPRDLASSVAGNGLGLYLCRALAHAMGGTIWAESSGVEGEGSTFHLRLPLSATESA